MKQRSPFVWGAAVLLAVTLAASCGGDRQRPPTEPINPVVPPGTPLAPPPSSPPGEVPSADIIVSIDAGKRFQTIEGFGTSMRVFSDPHLILLPTLPENVLRIPESVQGQILDSLYRGIGLTRVRLGTNSRGTEPVNDNADPSVTDLSKFDFAGLRNDAFFPAIREARSRGLTTWWASPYQIEPWMDASNPAENVEWAMATIRRWRDAGLEFPYYSIINEPTYGPSGGPWSGEYIRDVVKLLGRRLKEEGIRTKIVIPDDLNAGTAARIARVVLADAEARSYIAALPFHLYGLPLSQEPELKALGEQYGVPLWMSEHFVSDALVWGLSLHELLADYNVSAVDYLFGFFGEASQAQLISILHRGADYVGFRMEPHFHVFGQYSKYVRPGAVRIEARVPDERAKVSAFVREGRMTIVAINPGTTTVTVRFDLTGHSNRAQFAMVRTKSRDAKGDRLKQQASIQLIGNAFVAVLTPESVNTFYQ